MNKLLIFISVVIFGWSCSSSIDTVNLSPEDRLKNAIRLFEDEDDEEAVKEFEAILLQYSGSSLLDDAQYYLAQTRFLRQEYIIAAYEFSKLIKNMPASTFVADSQFMLAECYFELSPNYNLDQKYTVKAIEEFQAFIDFFPLNEKVQDAEARIHRAMIDIYVVTILVALVQLGALATIEARPGAVYFGAVVVLTMFAAESFDPRLIWDASEGGNE